MNLQSRIAIQATHPSLGPLQFVGKGVGAKGVGTWGKGRQRKRPSPMGGGRGG